MKQTSWEYTVQDFSPLLTYAGPGGTGNSRESNLDPSWQQICPLFMIIGLPGTPVCDLASAHTTNVSGASVSLMFYGL